jgi:hypothetical protein
LNAGASVLDWLYQKQLQIDDQWSMETPRGYRWWAHEHAQTIEVVGEEQDAELGTAYFVSVRTDMLISVEPSDHARKAISMAIAPFVTLSGPVLDSESRCIELCSLARVHDGNCSWIQRLLSVAAVLQLAEVKTLSGIPMKESSASAATSGHPESGMRHPADEMSFVAERVVSPAGASPSKWGSSDFQAVSESLGRTPPTLLATFGTNGLTAEFPFGDRSSLLQICADQPHPHWGNGILLVQTFPGTIAGIPNATIADRMAQELNRIELTKLHSGLGLGSFLAKNLDICFVSFVPNACYVTGLLENLYLIAATRASATEAWLLD